MEALWKPAVLIGLPARARRQNDRPCVHQGTAGSAIAASSVSAGVVVGVLADGGDHLHGVRAAVLAAQLVLGRDEGGDRERVGQLDLQPVGRLHPLARGRLLVVCQLREERQQRSGCVHVRGGDGRDDGRRGATHPRRVDAEGEHLGRGIGQVGGLEHPRNAGNQGVLPGRRQHSRSPERGSSIPETRSMQDLVDELDPCVRQQYLGPAADDE